MRATGFRSFSMMIGIFGIFAAGLSSGWYASKASQPPQTDVIRRTEKSAGYKFINPLLGSDTLGNPNYPEFSTLEKDIGKVINVAAESQGAPVQLVSVYARNLRSGHWMGINEDEKFAPASMLKVLIMIGYFRAAESDPAIFDTKLYYDGKQDQNVSETYRPTVDLTVGEHTTNELLERMITLSGNNSAELLKANLDPKILEHLNEDFGLPVPDRSDQIDFMSAKSYSFVFRVLYNSTYLTRTSSEHALELLSRTNFQNGLVAGVPEGTIVSHKFGERSVFYSNGELNFRELHDCGIVYYPNDPYLLCVMTKGKQFPDLERIITDISRTVYRDYPAVIGH